MTPEFALAAACCRWPPSAQRDEAVAAAAAGIDWPLFVAVVARHRVAGLVWHALSRAKMELPRDIRETLSAAASAIAAQNLELAGASIRLKRDFDAANIPVLFVKGLTLGQLAYRDISLKMGWDVDILVPPERLKDALAILEKHGYQHVIPEPPIGRDQLADWHGVWKESVWRDSNGVHVELHTQLADNRALISRIDCRSPRLDVAVLGHVFPTLQIDELFAYLCVHGASSSWFRLKWIADLAALISPCERGEIERLYRASQRLGAGRAAAQALLLADHLFDTKVPAELVGELRSDRINRWLFAGALRKLAGRTVAKELARVRLGTASIHVMQLGLLPGWKYRFSEIKRQAAAPEDLLKWRLPAALHFLYPVFRLLRRIRHVR